MVNFTVNRSTELVLDLAVGTGDSAREIIKKGIKVIGVDISFEMIKNSKNKINRKNYSAIVASGYNIPFKDNTFDAVTCAFGIRNMHDTEKALKEIYRVIRKKGIALILEFSMPDNFFRRPYIFYLRKVVPFIASIFSNRQAYEYLGESIENFYKPQDFIKLLEDCGFKGVQGKSLSFGCVHIYWGEK